MKRRHALLTFATAPTCIGFGNELNSAIVDYKNPYEEVDWSSWETVDSMSHQHQGTSDASREVFHAMGYRHFAFSNYYPSAPTDLPNSFRETHPEISWAPNAEQHSFLDTGLHFNSLGSRLATGYGSWLSSAERAAPVDHEFNNVRVFNESRPWEGVYRFDLSIEGKGDGPDEKALAIVTVEGANVCDRKNDFADEGPITDRTFAAGKHGLNLRAHSATVRLKIDYDPEAATITQCRLMQGTYRPWREVFRAALDGDPDAYDESGLIHPDGGGITLNHPTGGRDDYLEMLDFDPRVLGIEVWNQLTSGFGSDRGFYNSMTEPPSHFYKLWDEILATGRRCWGFFVKDHKTYGRGRNVLLSPPLADLSMEKREGTLLRSYRNGTFFGSVAAIACDEKGNVIAPFDHSQFRFSNIELLQDDQGHPKTVAVSVAGNSPELRPNVQIRFVTDKGIAATVDASEAEFEISSQAELPRFIRIEAFAYPDTHKNGKPLDAETIGKLDVAEIAQLHDRYAEPDSTWFGNPAELRTPVPIVDQIFSQPILQKLS